MIPGCFDLKHGSGFRLMQAHVVFPAVTFTEAADGGSIAVSVATATFSLYERIDLELVLEDDLATPTGVVWNKDGVPTDDTDVSYVLTGFEATHEAVGSFTVSVTRGGTAITSASVALSVLHEVRNTRISLLASFLYCESYPQSFTHFLAVLCDIALMRSFPRRRQSRTARTPLPSIPATLLSSPLRPQAILPCLTRG